MPPLITNRSLSGIPQKTTEQIQLQNKEISDTGTIQDKETS